eukprot:scaffold21095_cov129-Isochrysis_galbana.AAC.1
MAPAAAAERASSPCRGRRFCSWETREAEAIWGEPGYKYTRALGTNSRLAITVTPHCLLPAPPSGTACAVSAIGQSFRTPRNGGEGGGGGSGGFGGGDARRGGDGGGLGRGGMRGALDGSGGGSGCGGGSGGAGGPFEQDTSGAAPMRPSECRNASK